MTEAAKKVEITTHRFFLPDFSEVGIWLIGRLKQKYPAMSDPYLMSWLRSLTQSSDHLFLRNGQSVLLAEMKREGIDSATTVYLRFCMCESGAEESAAYLLDDLVRWAQGLGAKEIDLSTTLNDVPENLMGEVMGTISKRTVRYWKAQK